MKKNIQKISCGFFLFVLVVPSFFSIFFLNGFNNNGNYGRDHLEINLNDNLNYDLNNPKSAALSSINFDDGVQLFQRDDYNISSLIVHDYRRESLSSNHFSDLIITNLGGNIDIIQGPNYIFNPFTTVAWDTVLNMRLADRSANQFSSGEEKILLGVPHHIRPPENIHHIISISDSGNSTIAKFDSITYNDVFEVDNWDVQNQTLTTNLVDETDKVNTVFQTDFVFPHLENEFVMGTDDGLIIILNARNDNLYPAPVYEFTNQLVYQSPNGDSVKKIEVVDLNNDGYKDIIALFNNGTIKRFFVDKTQENPYDHWDNEVNLLHDPSFIDFSLSDLNNNGFMEIIVVSDNNQIILYKNSNKNFQSNNCYDQSFNKNTFDTLINDIKFGDLDNDGDMDIVLALNNGSIAILENPWNFNRTKHFSERHRLFSSDLFDAKVINPADPSSFGALTLTLIDYNQNGQLDILSGHENGYVFGWKNKNYQFVSQDWEESFGEKLLLIPEKSGYLITDVKFGDMNQDGSKDIVVAYSKITGIDPVVSIYTNPGDRNFYTFNDFEEISINLGKNSKIHNIQLYDMDNDGRLDICISLVGGQIIALENRFDHSLGNPFGLGSFQSHDLFTATLTIDSEEITLSGEILMDDFLKNGYPEVLLKTNDGILSMFGRDHESVDIFSNEGWSIAFEDANIIYNSSNQLNFLGPELVNMIGYFPDLSNYLVDPIREDLVFVDTNSVYLIPCQNSLARLGENEANNNDTLPYHRIYHNESIEIFQMAVVTDPLNQVPVILISGIHDSEFIIGTISKSKHRDLDAGFTYVHRYSSSAVIRNLISGDFNNDGYEEIIFSDPNGKIHLIPGLNSYLGNNNPFSEPVLIHDSEINFPIYNAIKRVDLDGDGDLDLLYMPNNRRELFFVRNALYEDLNNSILEISIEPTYSADTVEIIIDMIEEKYTEKIPILEITYEGETTFHTMINQTANGEKGKNFYYEYTLQGNGTYSLTFTIADQWGNVEADNTHVFFGDFIEPELEIEILQYQSSLGNFVNGSVDIYIRNLTEPIGLNYNNKIGINVSKPDFGYTAKYFETSAEVYDSENPENNDENILYYLGDGEWFIRFSQFLTVSERPEIAALPYVDYYIGFNATDIHGRFFTFEERTIRNDPVLPELIIKSTPLGSSEDDTQPRSTTEIIDSNNPYIPIHFEFTDHIDTLTWSVVNGTGDNVLFGGDYVTEKNVGDTYITNFRTTDDGNLTIIMTIVDKAGNYKYIEWEFDLLPNEIDINSNQYFVSGRNNRETTSIPIAYVHFRGYFINEFRLRYDGLNGSDGTNWTTWYEYPVGGYFDVLVPQSGFRIQFKVGDYGIKTVELELRNSHETIYIEVGSINYTTIEGEDLNLWYIFGPVIGLAVIISAIYYKRNSSGVGGGDWKKYLKDVD